MKKNLKLIAAVLAGVALLTVFICAKARNRGTEAPQNAESGTEESTSDAVAQITDFSELVCENEKGEAVFALSIEDFVEYYNLKYYEKHGAYYLGGPYSDGWYNYPEPSPRFGYDAVRFKFSEDKMVWPMPTLSMYTPDGDEIYEIRLTFDDHGYQERLYEKYKDMSCCLLGMVCGGLKDEELDALFGDLYKLSDSNFFGDHHHFADPDRPPLTEIYRYGDVGFYCFYGAGNIEICMLPLTDAAAEILRSEGTRFVDINS